MHYLMIIVGTICVIGGFALTSDLYRNNKLNVFGSLIMLLGMVITFTGMLNAFVPGFFNN